MFTEVANSYKASKDKTKLRIAGGAPFEAPPPTRIEVSVMDLQKALEVEDQLTYVY
jgi:hypothetical protein